MSEVLRSTLDSPWLTAVVICPSNPYLSIAPVLALPGMRAALARRRVPVVAVSPIVAGKALKGPAAKIMRELGKQSSSLEVARFYSGLIDALVVDRADAALSDAIRELGIQPAVTNTIMTEPLARIELARFIIELVAATADVSTAGSPA
jgi:LPPG:FO 2-phospho-L-lactate transferase